MAFLEIPLRSDLDFYFFTIDLDQKTYGFKFHFNGRMQRWIFDIAQEDGTPIVEGLPVFTGSVPLAIYKDARLPPGELIFIDTSGQNLDPAQDDLGDRVSLVYADSSEVI